MGKGKKGKDETTKVEATFTNVVGEDGSVVKNITSVVENGSINISPGDMTITRRDR